MSKVSIIIPACGEKEENLTRTIDSIYENATGEIEILIGFNGPPYIIPRNIDGRYIGMLFPRNVGIKTNINALAAMATGKYIYKSDAHCSFGKGFDEILQKDMQDDWIVTPRFYVLDGKTWKWQDERFYDYFYLSCPFTDPKGFRFKAGGHWPERTKERLLSPITIDETPQFHGSGWFMAKDRFFELGGFPIQDPYGHAQEPLWLGLKNWLMGGKVMVNKNTWYAHLHQDSKDRGYAEDRVHTEKTYNQVAHYWVREEGFKEFIEKFMPMPSWTPDWEQQLSKEIS